MEGFQEELGAVLGQQVSGVSPVGGGCIHRALRVELDGGRLLFVKVAGDEAGAAMLVAEQRGLERMAPHIRVPEVLGAGGGWLALKWLELSALGGQGWADLGSRLAALHRVCGDGYGLDQDNFIGATPQINTSDDDWCRFFRDRRIAFQLELAERAGHRLDRPAILGRVGEILEGHAPPPSLLHGDLWSGNVAMAAGGAVLFDPAVYYGDAETDLAMLELFGGRLPQAFFEAYGQVAPGREERRALYDLYHALNHLNLFGGGYRSMVNRCLAAMGLPG